MRNFGITTFYFLIIDYFQHLSDFNDPDNAEKLL